MPWRRPVTRAEAWVMCALLLFGFGATAVVVDASAHAGDAMRDEILNQSQANGVAINQEKCMLSRSLGYTAPEDTCDAPPRTSTTIVARRPARSNATPPTVGTPATRGDRVGGDAASSSSSTSTTESPVPTPLPRATVP